MKTSNATMRLNMDEAILRALKEDIPWEDVSANAVVPEGAMGEAELIAKQEGVMAGLPVFRRTFELLDEKTEVALLVSDGDFVTAGQKIAIVRGELRTLLSAERTALNFLGRMSGIATYTRAVVALLEGTGIRLLDTRKTTPGLRVFEKYAVTVGGGNNHRFNLSDGVLLKDNHIGAAGGVKAAIEAARAYAPFVRKIEVEVETLQELEEALQAGADIVMLDNMRGETLIKAVELAAGKAEIEVSGNITKENIALLKGLKIDYVSSGALTHSAPAFDVSLKHMHAV